MAFGDRKLTGFHTKPRKPLKRSGGLSSKAPLKASKRASKKKTAKKGSNTQRAKKMAKKRKLLEKYDLPSIPHSRWGTGKHPTETDLLRGMLWTVFSKYIRERDQDKPCISCGKIFDIKQAGHFVPVGGSSVGLWFDEKNVHGECEGCNAFDSFHVVPMRKNLITLYGEEVVEDLEARRHQTKKLEDVWYVDQIKHYHTLVDNP